MSPTDIVNDLQELVVSTYSGKVTDPLQLYKSKHRISDLCLALLRSNQGPEEYTAILAGGIWLLNHILVLTRFIMQSLAKSPQPWTSSHLWALRILSLRLRMAGWAWPSSVQRPTQMRDIFVRIATTNLSIFVNGLQPLLSVPWHITDTLQSKKTMGRKSLPIMNSAMFCGHT